MTMSSKCIFSNFRTTGKHYVSIDDLEASTSNFHLIPISLAAAYAHFELELSLHARNTENTATNQLNLSSNDDFIESMDCNDANANGKLLNLTLNSHSVTQFTLQIVSTLNCHILN